jgi:hypothetical protein
MVMVLRGRGDMNLSPGNLATEIYCQPNGCTLSEVAKATYDYHGNVVSLAKVNGFSEARVDCARALRRSGIGVKVIVAAKPFQID